MKKRVVYAVPGGGMTMLAALSVLLMLGSAVIRIVWAAGEREMSPGLFWPQVVLPVAACALFVLIVLVDRKDRLYRTAVPVWMGCIFFAVKAVGFPSVLHMVLCLLLYSLVAVLYTATVTGRVPTQVPLCFLFGLPLLYHLLVEDPRKLGWPLHDWLPEVSVLCCMAGLLSISLAMRRHLLVPGEYARRFGDRNDGRRVRTLSPIFSVSPYIMKTRNTSQNFITDQIEVSNTERYILEKRREGMKNFGVLHVLLAAYVRTCARYPGLNRFIAGQKIYTRDREIEVNMTVKKEMSTDSPDTVIKVTFDPSDTAREVYERFHARVRQVKDTPAETSFDSLAGAFNAVPGLILKALVFVLQVADYFGWLPRWLTRLSPFHGSLYITSMASLGIPPIYHHLYDFGNVPVFCSFGRKRRAYEVQRDGTVARRKYVDCCFVTDERIVDGFYFAAAMRSLHELLSDPWQLDTPPEAVLRDQN